MTNLEIILTAITWIAYGVFNCYQHDWFEDWEGPYWILDMLCIFLAPIALAIRIFRGVFLHKLQ